MPNDRHSQGQKVFGKTEDACMHMFLDEAMVQDDQVIEQNPKTVEKDNCPVRSSVFSERMLVIFATIAKMLVLEIFR